MANDSVNGRRTWAHLFRTGPFFFAPKTGVATADPGSRDCGVWDGRAALSRPDGLQTCFPVFEKSAFSPANLIMIIADLGVHLLDAARFLFGEAECDLNVINHQINPGYSAERKWPRDLAMKEWTDSYR